MSLEEEHIKMAGKLLYLKTVTLSADMADNLHWKKNPFPMLKSDKTIKYIFQKYRSFLP